jgi:hypothetical protein
MWKLYIYLGRKDQSKYEKIVGWKQSAIPIVERESLRFPG